MRKLGFIAGAVLVITISGSARPQGPPPTDLMDGKVDVGAPALGIWPLRSPDDDQPADPKGFQAHLASTRQPHAEHVYPAGTWIVPEPGTYRLWLESRDSISPYPLIVEFPPASASEKGLALTSPAVPAAKLTFLQESVEMPEEACSVWWLHLDSHVVKDVVHHEMIRQVPLPQADEDTEFPEGHVVGFLRADESGEILALTSVTEAKAGTVNQISSQPLPADLSALLLQLHRPVPVRLSAEDDLVLRLRLSGGRTEEPDAVIRATERIYAIYSHLPPGDAKLEVTSSHVGLPPTDLRLRAGRIEHDEIDLRKLPRLEVTLILPPQLDGLSPTVHVMDRETGDRMEKELGPGQDRADFEAVPPSRLKVIAVVGNWELQDQLDLRDWSDGSVTLVADGTSVYGTVFYGKEPHQASLEFSTGEVSEPLKVETDGEGNFEAFFVNQANYSLAVTLAGRSMPYMTFYEVDEDGRHDIVLPANQYVFHVADAVTGDAIEGAKVMVQNRRDGELGIVTSFTAVTGGDGSAITHPMAPGELEYLAEAEGYRPSEPESEDVPESREERIREIEILLEPEGESRPLALRLAGGAPAAGAQLMAPSGSGAPLWQGVADGTGKVAVPKSLQGSLILARHPSAGGAVRILRGFAEAWDLASPASPLRLQAVRSNGEAVPWAGVVFWIGDLRLPESALTWLAGSPVHVDRSGLLVWPNPPREPVAVLLYRPDPDLHQVVQSGAYDTRRTQIAPPWPDAVRVEVVE